MPRDPRRIALVEGRGEDSKEVVIANRQVGSDDKLSLGYDFAHPVPPQSGPAWVKRGPPADPANLGGYVRIDKETMQ